MKKSGGKRGKIKSDKRSTYFLLAVMVLTLLLVLFSSRGSVLFSLGGTDATLFTGAFFTIIVVAVLIALIFHIISKEL